MDMSKTIEADSTQLNAVEIIDPITVTITGSSKGPDAKRPVDLELAEFPGRAYRPCKSMRRLLVEAWGKDSNTYVGRRIMLYNEKSIQFGPNPTGGIRIKALSDIKKTLVSPQRESQNKMFTYVVEPLPDIQPLPPISDDDAVDFARAISEAATTDDLSNIAADLKSWDLGTHRSSLQAAWTARNNELKGTGA